jgi:uncharacterized protein (TIGR02246 family)
MERKSGQLMKALVTVLLSLFLLGSIAEHTGSADAGSAANRNAEEQAARKVIATVAMAWNKNDVESIARLFVTDAVLITPTGSVIRSRSAIRQRIIDERNGKLKDTTLHGTVEDVSLPDSTTAVVKGKYQIKGMKILGMEKSPEGPFVLHQKKLQGRWMIAKADLTRNQNNNAN